MILACRDKQRTQVALDKIINETNNRKVFFEELDLGDLSSVRRFAQIIHQKFNRLDILINNAGKIFQLNAVIEVNISSSKSLKM